MNGHLFSYLFRITRSYLQEICLRLKDGSFVYKEINFLKDLVLECEQLVNRQNALIQNLNLDVQNWANFKNIADSSKVPLGSFSCFFLGF